MKSNILLKYIILPLTKKSRLQTAQLRKLSAPSILLDIFKEDKQNAKQVRWPIMITTHNNGRNPASVVENVCHLKFPYTVLPFMSVTLETPLNDSCKLQSTI